MPPQSLLLPPPPQTYAAPASQLRLLLSADSSLLYFQNLLKCDVLSCVRFVAGEPARVGSFARLLRVAMNMQSRVACCSGDIAQNVLNLRLLSTTV